MKKYKTYKNFITDKEADLLCKWIDNNINFFQDAAMGGKRLTSRFSDTVIYPDLAFNIQNRIIKKLKLKDYLMTEYKDGMVASCAYPGDHCYLHRDPVYQEGYQTLHCNILLSDIKGGEPFVLKNPVEEEIIKVSKKDMWTYIVSDIFHGSKLLIENERKMWVFGFCVKNNV